MNFSLRRQKQGLTYAKDLSQGEKKRHLHEVTEGLVTGDKNTVLFCLSRSWFLSLILLPKQPTSTVLVIKRVWQFTVNRKFFLKMKGTFFSETKGCPQNRVAALPILVKFPQGCLQKRLSELGVGNLPDTAGYLLSNLITQNKELSKGKI